MIGWQLAAVVGAVFGLGVFLVIYALRPAVPDLGEALARLDGVASPVRAKAEDKTTRAVRARTWLATMVRRLPGIKIPAADLRLLDTTVDSFLLRKVTFAVVSLVAPLCAVQLASLAGLRSQFTLPVVGGLVLAVIGFFVPDAAVRQRAARRRREFRRALCSYLDLAALERAAQRGTAESLTRPAELGQGWVFRQINTKMREAQRAGTQPWEALAELADEVGVTELSDLASIGRIAGTSGASIHRTLRARSDGLRAALLAEEKTAAKIASERMVIPGALLAFVFAGLLLYPAIVRFTAG